MNDMEVIRRQFAEWMSLPKTHRVPKTQLEFADEYGVSREVLSRWKKDPEFKQEVADAGLDWFSSDDITDIVFALKKSAKGGNVNAIKLCLTMAGVITDGRKDDPEAIDPSKLGELDLSALEALANGGI